MSNKSKHKCAVLAAIALMVASCGITGSRGNGDDNYFSAFKTFDNQLWSYAEPVEFVVDTLRDTLSRRGTLLLSLRHTHGYGYGNIWLELSYPLNDSVEQADTFNVVLADSYGRWLGHGSGPSMLVTDTLSRNFELHRGMKLRLRHIMRTDTLANIEQVGIVYLPVD